MRPYKPATARITAGTVTSASAVETAMLAVQSFINIGVNMGLLPTKGLTLPLLSYGGSALLANCSALAIVLRIDWENRQTLRGYKV